MMAATNAGWPEAFGFSVVGGRPVTIGAVEEGGSAQQAGLQTGDMIAELDGENVQEYGVSELIERAREASKVPPSMVVVSRVRSVEISPSREGGGLGITFRGDAPVFIRTVDFQSSAWNAGVRSGDLLLEVNGREVRHSTKQEVHELLRAARGVPLRLVVVVGGAQATSIQYSGNPGKRIEKKFQRSKAFRDKVNYYLMDDLRKRDQLFALLRLYTKDRDIDSLVSSLDILLDTAVERRLLQDLKPFIDPTQVARFDALASRSGHRKMSVPFLPGQVSPGSLLHSGTPRLVMINRGSGGFGFNLSGNAPVVIRSVDPASPAMGAKLKPGDHILEINGHDVRSATHSQVVQLLKTSGASPSLLVAASNGAGSRRASLISTTSSQRSGTSSAARLHSAAFRDKMEATLAADEKQAILRHLSKYSQNRDLSTLVEGLTGILKDPKKASVFHYICQMLPDEVQREFDHLAAASVSSVQGSGLGPRHWAESGDPLDDVMFLAQVGQLPQESVHTIRHVSSNQFHHGREGRGGGVPGTEELGREGRGVPGAELELKDSATRRIGGSVGDQQQFNDKATLQSKRENPLSTPAVSGTKDVMQKLTSSMLKSTKDGVTSDSTVSMASSQGASGAPPPPPPPPFTPMVGPDGVPLPPPPPPSSSLHTSSNLKRVNWDKLNSTEGTIWRELSGLEDALELCEIESKFSNQKPKDAKGSKQQQNPTILDPKKAYNLSILLRHLKLPVEQIKEAVLSCDNSLLSEQHWRQMEAFAPDQRECASYAQVDLTTFSAMGVADKFSCEMSTVPLYRERLQSIIFKMHFKEKVDEIKPDLEKIIEASMQLQNSKNLKRILEIVLAIGNYMNAGHKRVGAAQGFRISYLPQLKGLRTSDNKSSLLHFLVATVERKFSNTLSFPNDIPAVVRAARVSGQTLEDEIADLSEKLDVTQRTIRAVCASHATAAGDKFEEVMSTFVLGAEQEMTQLVRLQQEMKLEYERAARFFGEDPSKIRVDEFYGAFAGFVTDFEGALKEIRYTREQELQKEKRMKEQQERTKRRTFRLSSSSLSQHLSPSKHHTEAPKDNPKPSIVAGEDQVMLPGTDQEQLKWQSDRSHTGSNDSIGCLWEQGDLPLQDPLANSGLEFDGETNF